MLTRCPRCDTAFRVTPEQLKARQGRVRCGQCQAVFNALETLVDETPAAIGMPLPPAEPPAAAKAPAEPPSTVEAPPEDVPLEAAANNSAEEAATPPAEPEPPVEPPPPAEPEAPDQPPPAAGPAPSLAAEESPPPPAEPLLHEEEELAEKRRVWPWLLASLAALTALALQAAIAFRVELATVAPELKPALVSLCDLAGCRVELPRKIELIGIETSDLRPDPAQANRLRLEASLRNRAPFAQAWPHLELTLTDTGDGPLLRRVLVPTDYLPAEADAAAGLAAHREQAIHLELETAGVAAAGYRLYIFYP